MDGGAGGRWAGVAVDPWDVFDVDVNTAVRRGEYAIRDLDLGYAATVHRTQGLTVDTAHVLVTDADSRGSLYVASSRARPKVTRNHPWTGGSCAPPGPRSSGSHRNRRGVSSSVCRWTRPVSITR